MLRIALDTSYLISFADPSRPHHQTAVDFYRHCVSAGIAMHLSTLAAAEFEVGQSITDLPLSNFRILPFNLLHARKAAEFHRSLRDGAVQRDPADPRKVVANDLNILGQAEEEGIRVVLTEDENTLSRMATRLRENNLSSIWAVLLRDGFAPGRLERPDEELLF